MNPTREIGYNWKLYKYNDGKYIQATISDKQQQTFLGLTDSVKTISLQVKNINGNNVTSNLNSLTIQCSKNYGLTSLLNFASLPNVYFGSYNLIGLTNPTLGVQLLTTRQIYDYEAGDEFHYQATHSYYPNGANDYIQQINKILSV